MARIVDELRYLILRLLVVGAQFQPGAVFYCMNVGNQSQLGTDFHTEEAVAWFVVGAYIHREAVGV